MGEVEKLIQPSLTRILEKKEPLTLFPDQKLKKFSTFASLYNYINREYERWQKYPNIYVAKKNAERFKIARDYFKLAIEKEDPSEKAINLTSGIDSLRKAPNGIEAFVYSETLVGQTLLYKCSQGFSNTYIEAFNLFVNTGRIHSLTNKEETRAYFDAYHALYPIDVSTKICEEEKSLAQLVERFNENSEISYKEYEERWQKIDTDYHDFEDKTFEWRKSEQDELHNYVKEKQEVLELVESTYKEKLKLEAPVKYWENAQKSNRKAGVLWIIIASVMSILTAVYIMLVVTYILPPELKGDMSVFNASSIRSTLLITAGVSIMVYILRLFVKMAISSFHLSKDASERVTLTYLFLSLSKDSTISETERVIVLQALFSRADTGLLKGDSTPSYSSDGLMQIIAKCMAGKN